MDKTIKLQPLASKETAAIVNIGPTPDLSSAPSPPPDEYFN